MLHQIPLKAFRKTVGCASCSTLYMQRLLASIRIKTIKTEEMKDPRNTKHTENNRNIAKNGDRDKDIKKKADPVTFIADLYDVKDFLFHGMSFLKLRYTLL